MRFSERINDILMIALVVILVLIFVVCIYQSYSNSGSKPSFVESMVYPVNATFAYNVSGCRIVDDYRLDDKPLSIIEYDCMSRGPNIILFSDPKQYNITKLLVTIREYNPKVPKSLIVSYSIEGDGIYVILSNNTKIKAVKNIDVTVKVDQGGYIVINNGANAVQLIIKAEYLNGETREIGYTCTRCSLSYVSIDQTINTVEK